SVAALITSAYAGGTWTGPGITSSATDAAHAVGFAEASSLASIPAVFGTVDSDTILIRRTRYGDATLDGIVNVNDFSKLASNFGLTGKFWGDGDFNFDNVVNVNDFSLLATNFGLVSSNPVNPTPQDWANLAAAVPEPMSIF